MAKQGNNTGQNAGPNSGPAPGSTLVAHYLVDAILQRNGYTAVVLQRDDQGKQQGDPGFIGAPEWFKVGVADDADIADYQLGKSVTCTACADPTVLPPAPAQGKLLLLDYEVSRVAFYRDHASVRLDKDPALQPGDPGFIGSPPVVRLGVGDQADIAAFAPGQKVWLALEAQ